MDALLRMIGEEEVLVTPDDCKLQYSGRIDFGDQSAPTFIYPCSGIAVRFTGSICKVIVSNRNCYAVNYLGFIIDGRQDKIIIPNEGQVCLTLAENLEDKEHTLLFFKRMDASHIFYFYGFIFSKGVRLKKAEDKPHRRIEVYGDSISAGEVSEAVAYVGMEDPVHNGEYSNSWYSYAWMTARKLNAEIHNISQGGIALLDGTGWFAGPDFIGLESTYHLLQYQREAAPLTAWDFNRYTPHVVIVAIGANDSNPTDYMAADYRSEQSQNWRRHYKEFVQKLRSLYPKAVIILTTTILRHDAAWDRSIEEITNELKDDHIYHFMYSQNGIGTYGHVRIPEAETMSDELAAYITSLGDTVWED